MPTADPVVLRSTKPITFDESIITGVVGEVNGSLALWNGELGAVGLWVTRRDASTLERIIVDHVLPGTITDVWGGYGNVSNINNGVYQHEVVVHAQGFVHPVHSEINTQSTERVVDVR